jgi:hypothetical protein
MDMRMVIKISPKMPWFIGRFFNNWHSINACGIISPRWGIQREVAG